MNEKNICNACATKFPAGEKLPEVCPICADDRQYVPDDIQAWTSTAQLEKNHCIEIREISENLYELKVSPSFSIGQRALFVVAPDGNVLWDCIPLLDKAAFDFIESKGGIRAIAFSHPHFYSNMNDWAEKFDCPVYIHAADEKWIVNKTERIKLWSGAKKQLWNGIEIYNIGGHFAGSSILRVPFLSSKGAILCGDTFVLSLSRKHLAAMHSYPNRMPLPLSEIARIGEQMKTLEFDALYGWNNSQVIENNTKTILENSLARYF